MRIMAVALAVSHTALHLQHRVAFALSLAGAASPTPSDPRRLRLAGAGSPVESHEQGSGTLRTSYVLRFPHRQSLAQVTLWDVREATARFLPTVAFRPDYVFRFGSGLFPGGSTMPPDPAVLLFSDRRYNLNQGVVEVELLQTPQIHPERGDRSVALHRTTGLVYASGPVHQMRVPRAHDEELVRVDLGRPRRFGDLYVKSRRDETTDPTGRRFALGDWVVLGDGGTPGTQEDGGANRQMNLSPASTALSSSRRSGHREVGEQRQPESWLWRGGSNNNINFAPPSPHYLASPGCAAGSPPGGRGSSGGVKSLQDAFCLGTGGTATAQENVFAQQPRQPAPQEAVSQLQLVETVVTLQQIPDFSDDAAMMWSGGHRAFMAEGAGEGERSFPSTSPDYVGELHRPTEEEVDRLLQTRTRTVHGHVWQLIACRWIYQRGVWLWTLRNYGDPQLVIQVHARGDFVGNAVDGSDVQTRAMEVVDSSQRWNNWLERELPRRNHWESAAAFLRAWQDALAEGRLGFGKNIRQNARGSRTSDEDSWWSAPAFPGGLFSPNELCRLKRTCRSLKTAAEGSALERRAAL
eukprot:g3449.t1